LLKRGSQVCIGVPAELLELGDQLVARGEHLCSLHVLTEPMSAALSGAREAAIAREIDQPRLPPVQVACAEGLLERNLAAQTANAVRVDIQVVAVGRRRRRELCKRMQDGDRTMDSCGTVERRPAPRHFEFPE